MRSTTDLTYNVYLKHKEYFDSSLILLLERQQKEIDKLKEKCEIYDATIYKLRAKIKIQKHMLDELQYTKKVNKSFYAVLEKLIVENERLSDENKQLKSDLEYFRLNQPKQKDNTNSNIPSSFVMFKANSNNRVKSTNHKGGQVGHPVHKSKLSKPDKIITKYVKKVPIGAIKCTDDNGMIYYATQLLDATFKTIVTEYRYYLSDDGAILPNKIMNQYKINPVVYSDKLKNDVLYLYSKGIIAFDRLSQMINVLSNDKIHLRQSTIVNWIEEYALTHENERQQLLHDLLNNPIIHVDETGFRVNGENCWIHVLTDGDRRYYQMTDKRSEFLEIIEDYHGILIHDHFKPYYQLDCEHAECNAHIERYLKAGIDFYNNTACAKMLNLLQLALHEKHELQRQGINDMTSDRLKYYEDEYDNIIDSELLKFKEDNPNIKKKYIPEYIKLFQRMKEYKNQHLMFLHDFDVPYTNNNAERALRMIKTRKKVSGQVSSIERGNQLLLLLGNT